MKQAIIDTNVAVVANGQNKDVQQSCIDACILFLTTARTDKIILLDEGDEIREEYARALVDARPHQLGMQFLVHILRNQFDTKFVKNIQLLKNADGEFYDFPETPSLDKFDRSDRKFAALARKTKTAVTNATDSDWVDHHTALKKEGIDVNFLCGKVVSDWFTHGGRK